jgi:hypothetical protein
VRLISVEALTDIREHSPPATGWSISPTISNQVRHDWRPKPHLLTATSRGGTSMRPDRSTIQEETDAAGFLA